MEKPKDIKLTKLAKCAGCGAKVGAGELRKLLMDIPTRTDERLIVGFDRADDAAAYIVPDGMVMVQTLDFFPPVADDPFLFGQIAAANALSDIYAMGGEPKIALNIMCVPEDMPHAAVHMILKGGADKAYEAGAIIAGGHSIHDDTPKYGLSVTGFVHPDKLLKNCGAQPGDILILTKPLGIGILTAAHRGGLIRPEDERLMYSLMSTLNKYARDIMVKYRVHACTDVTGFGLMGHCAEMAEGSDATVELYADSIDIIPAALEFARMGILPEGMYRNRAFAQPLSDSDGMDTALMDVLYDPQTSGGLLMAVHPGDAGALMDELAGAVPSAQRVGRVMGYDGTYVRVRPALR